MKKRIVSVLLAATLILSNLCVAEAAQVTEIPESMQVQAAAAAEVDTVAAESRKADLEENDISGLFVNIGGKTISSVTDKDYNKTLTIPSGITVSDGANIKLAMQNVPALGITDKVSDEYAFRFSTIPISLDDLIREVKSFQGATVNGSMGGTVFHYSVSGLADENGTTISAVTSDAAAAYENLTKHMTQSTVSASGMKLEKGTYIQIGDEKMEYDNNYQGDVVIGGGQGSLNELQNMIRGAFKYRKVAPLKDTQIAVFLPKGSYVSVAGKAGELESDMMIRISGLKDGYNIVNASTKQTVLSALYEAHSSNDMFQVLLRSVNSLATGADGSTINVEAEFSEASVSGVSLNKRSMEMGEGTSELLIASVAPDTAFNRTVSWSSSNEEVAAVKDGKVTALKEGTAQITAVTIDGGYTASCTVQVKKTGNPSIPGTEGKNIIIVEIPESAAVGENLTDDVERQIKDVIANAGEDEVVILQIPQNEGKTPSLSPHIFEEAAASDMETLVVQTVASPGDYKSVEATYIFDVSGKLNSSAGRVKTGISKEVAKEQTDLIQKNMPSDARTLAIELEHSGSFPVPVTITVNVAPQFKAGDLLYMYYVNKDASKLEQVGTQAITVDEKGMVSFGLSHASAYVFSNKKAVAFVEATGVVLNPSSLEMKTGQSRQLTATVTPADATDKSLIWTSSNASVVSVAGGRITALKSGTATITARTYNGKSASCSVKVTLGVPSEFKVENIAYNRIKISWKKLPGASKYQIFRSTKKYGKYKRIITVPSTSFTDKKVKIGQKYYYKVKAYTSGITGNYTSVKSATARLVAPEIRVKAGKKKATVKWSRIKNASGYSVYYKAGKNGVYKAAGTVGAKKFSLKINKLKSKKTYYIRVRSYKVVKGKKYYGTYSDVKSVKIK